ncbi:Transmembrane protein 41A [Globomyces sp. JEL0801]|nr:Transmembrane protein 41A [Globomyces sp. JEL0801]
MSILRSRKISKALILAVVVFVWVTVILRYAATLPAIKYPHSLIDIKLLAVSLKEYRDSQSWNVFVLFTLVFLFKQAFGIPGAALLNILAGTLFGFYALPLVCLYAALGSSITYIMSKHVLGHLVFGVCVPMSSIQSMKIKVDANRNNLLAFLVALRVFPIIPGWLLALASPYVGVPLPAFFLSTLIGLIPYSYVCIQAAFTLSTINSISDILTFWVLIQLVILVLIILVPVLYKKRILAYFGEGSKEPLLPVVDMV